jgi:hypothetical protein
MMGCVFSAARLLTNPECQALGLCPRRCVMLVLAAWGGIIESWQNP